MPDDPRNCEGRLKLLLRDERACLARCRKSGLVSGWTWSAKSRQPPLPFHAAASEPGKCRVCGQPIWKDKKAKVLSTKTWHHFCVSTYFLWTKPSDYAELFIWRQGGLCPITAEPIGPPARTYVGQPEMDHEVPIYRVRRDHATEPWFELLRYWGPANLRALSRPGHLQKCALEAAERKHNGAHNPGRQMAILPGLE